MRSGRFPRHRLLVLLTVCAGLVTSACASTGPSLEIGFRRIALDLAFKDAELAGPVDGPTVVRKVIKADAVDVTPATPGPRRVQVVRVVAAAPGPTCPTAPEGLAPERPAFAVVKEPPEVGVYERHNEGMISIELGTQTIEVPVPERAEWVIPEVERFSSVPGSSGSDGGAVPEAVHDDPNLSTDVVEFSLRRQLTRGSSVTDTYRYTNEQQPPVSDTDPVIGGVQGNATGDFLYLVRRVTVSQGEETVFEPTPPIRVLRLNTPEGPFEESGVAHGGVDRETNVSMSVQSQIVSRELVDVCGEVVDTYRVQIKESFVDLASRDVSGNEGDAANYWNIQFDNGLLIVREQVDSTLRTTTEVAGAEVPVVVRYRYTSTLDSLEPEPLPEEPEESG